MTDRDGCTPLYCAAAWNRLEAVRLLERLGCPSSLRSLEGRTAVHVAAEQGWVALIDVLISELGNQVGFRGWGDWWWRWWLRLGAVVGRCQAVQSWRQPRLALPGFHQPPGRSQ